MGAFRVKVYKNQRSHSRTAVSRVEGLGQTLPLKFRRPMEDWS